jgi:glycosyltransferase involved in cell wall biosynthesis
MTAALQQIFEPKPESDNAGSFAPRVAILTVFVNPYRYPLFKSLESLVQELQILCSAPEDEAGRPWPAEYSELPMALQKGIIWRLKRKHHKGFIVPYCLYFPTDTIQRLRAFRPDVVISGEFGFRTLQALRYKKLRPSTKLIIWGTVSETSEKSRGLIRRCFRKWLLPKADAVFVNGESGARYLTSFGLAQDRIFSITPSCTMSLFQGVQREVPSCQSLRLVYVGQLIEQKGLIPFIAHLQRWLRAHPGHHVRFKLVGDGPMRSALECLSTDTGLKLEVVGNVPYQDVREHYVDADVFVFPSFDDEWGLVVNEALASGLPVLGSTGSQAVEILVRDRINGWLFEPHQSNSVYGAIDRMLRTTPAEWKTLQEGARASVRDITPENAASSIINAIRTLGA